MSKEHVRLIDANALKKRVVKVMFRDCPESGEFYAVGTDDIDIMPTIDPESLRPTAHWETRKISTATPLFGSAPPVRKDFFYMMVRQKKTIINIAHIAVQGW